MPEEETETTGTNQKVKISSLKMLIEAIRDESFDWDNVEGLRTGPDISKTRGYQSYSNSGSAWLDTFPGLRLLNYNSYSLDIHGDGILSNILRWFMDSLSNVNITSSRSLIEMFIIRYRCALELRLIEKRRYIEDKQNTISVINKDIEHARTEIASLQQLIDAEFNQTTVKKKEEPVEAEGGIQLEEGVDIG